jgi:hypothetical protein
VQWPGLHGWWGWPSKGGNSWRPESIGFFPLVSPRVILHFPQGFRGEAECASWDLCLQHRKSSSSVGYSQRSQATCVLLWAPLWGSITPNSPCTGPSQTFFPITQTVRKGCILLRGAGKLMLGLISLPCLPGMFSGKVEH